MQPWLRNENIKDVKAKYKNSLVLDQETPESKTKPNRTTARKGREQKQKQKNTNRAGMRIYCAAKGACKLQRALTGWVCLLSEK